MKHLLKDVRSLGLGLGLAALLFTGSVEAASAHESRRPVVAFASADDNGNHPQNVGADDNGNAPKPGADDNGNGNPPKPGADDNGNAPKPGDNGNGTRESGADDNGNAA